MARRKPPARDKKHAQKVHALRRAEERYGITPSLRKIAADIQAGRAVFLERHSLRVTRWRVNVEGKEVIVLYDSKRKSIVTFLLPNEEYPPPNREDAP